jgi:hypothetical protein
MAEYGEPWAVSIDEEGGSLPRSLTSSRDGRTRICSNARPTPTGPVRWRKRPPRTSTERKLFCHDIRVQLRELKCMELVS